MSVEPCVRRVLCDFFFIGRLGSGENPSTRKASRESPFRSEESTLEQLMRRGRVEKETILFITDDTSSVAKGALVRSGVGKDACTTQLARSRFASQGCANHRGGALPLLRAYMTWTRICRPKKMFSVFRSSGRRGPHARIPAAGRHILQDANAPWKRAEGNIRAEGTRDGRKRTYSAAGLDVVWCIAPNNKLCKFASPCWTWPNLLATVLKGLLVGRV